MTVCQLFLEIHIPYSEVEWYWLDYITQSAVSYMGKFTAITAGHGAAALRVAALFSLNAPKSQGIRTEFNQEQARRNRPQTCCGEYS